MIPVPDVHLAARPAPLRAAPRTTLSWRRRGSQLVLAVRGEVGGADVRALRLAVDLLVETCAHPVLDLGDARLDREGAEVLRDAGRQLAAEGRHLLVEGATPHLGRHLDVDGGSVAGLRPAAPGAAPDGLAA